ncbi:MAG: nuclear transport factor 2 family protein [Anaerolineales bacterium]
MSLTVPRQRFLNSASDSSGGGAPAEISESSLRAADAEQMRIIVDADAEAQQEFMHPNYIINGPMNRVLQQEYGRRDVGSRQDRERPLRTRNRWRIAITGNVGIVMGREVVHPTAASELGIRHGDKLLKRRFTNVFLFEDGKWSFLARQASIVS